MINQLSHYEALGVSPSASQSEIRSAYKALALKFHPVSSNSLVPVIFTDPQGQEYGQRDSDDNIQPDKRCLPNPKQREFSAHL